MPVYGEQICLTISEAWKLCTSNDDNNRLVSFSLPFFIYIFTRREERSGVRSFVTSSFTQSDQYIFIIYVLLILLLQVVYKFSFLLLVSF